jgi:hypothetical protein
VDQRSGPLVQAGDPVAVDVEKDLALARLAAMPFPDPMGCYEGDGPVPEDVLANDDPAPGVP